MQDVLRDATGECRVSVVIVAGTQRERCQRALKSVVDQAGLMEHGEVLLVDAGRLDQPPLPSASCPQVRTIPWTERTGYGIMRAAAVRQARGGIIAFLEEHAAARPGWLAGILAVYAETGCVGASGEIHSLNPGRGISDAVGMMNYYQWLPPIPTAYDSDILVGHNATYSRQALLGFGENLPALLDGEPMLQTLLIRQGGRLRIDPRISIGHQNEVATCAIMRGYYLWNRCFGTDRIVNEGWSLARRAWRLLSTPLVPLVRIVRMTWNLCRSGRVSLPHILRYWHVMFMAQCGAAVGLAAGYSVGVGSAARGLGDYELDIDRGPVEPLR